MIAALQIIDNGFPVKDLVGSWGGAIGMTQFIPTTYLDSGYDWNKDGQVDIWNDYEDVFASIQTEKELAQKYGIQIAFEPFGDKGMQQTTEKVEDDE